MSEQFTEAPANMLARLDEASSESSLFAEAAGELRRLSAALTEASAAHAHAAAQWEGCIGRGVKAAQEIKGLREALCRVKLLALTAGGEGGMEVHASLSRMVRIALDVGITERLSELRATLKEGQPHD